MAKNILFIIMLLALFTNCNKEETEPLTKNKVRISKEILPVVLLNPSPDINYDSIPPNYIEYVYDDSKKLLKRILHSAPYRFYGSAEDYNRKLFRSVMDSIVYNHKGLPAENFHGESSFSRHEKFIYFGNILKRESLLFIINR